MAVPPVPTPTLEPESAPLAVWPCAQTSAQYQRAGLVAFERNVALLAGLRGDRLVPRTSFFQLTQVRKARERGVALRVIAHEDVLVFRRPR
jgi:hypothetical protein